MTFTLRACAFEMILQPEPGSRLVKRRTLAPLARHWSACETCFWASPSALTTVAAMPAFLKAATNVGRSCVSHRTDDFVSGSNTHAGVVAALLVLLANAAVTATLTAASAMTDVVAILFTIIFLLVMCRDVRLGKPITPGGLVQCRRGPNAGLFERA